MMKFLRSIFPIPKISAGQRFSLDDKFSTVENDVIVKSVTLGTVRFVSADNAASDQQRSLPLRAFKMQYRLVKN